jgi:hypothetical protein
VAGCGHGSRFRDGVGFRQIIHYGDNVGHHYRHDIGHGNDVGLRERAKGRCRQNTDGNEQNCDMFFSLK